MWATVHGFASIATISAISNLVGLISTLAPILKTIISPVGIILGLLGLLYATNEDFRDLINDLGKTLFNILGEILKPLVDLLVALFSILKPILSLLNPLINTAVELIYHALIPVLVIVETIVKVVATLLEFLGALFTWNWSELGNNLNNLWKNWSTSDFIGNVATKYYADGGLPDKGTLFVAGEAGAEMVYNMPSGQSGVANIRQIEQAMYNALERHSANGGDPIVIQTYLDGEKVYENTTARAKSRGNIWAKA